MRRALPLVLLAACAAKAPPPVQHRVYQGQAMGSSLEIHVAGRDPAILDRAIAEARAEIDRLDRMMTDWKETGELMEINHNAGVRPVRVPPELYFLVRRSLQVSELTDGAFDITWAGAGKLWKWWEKDPRVPTSDEIRAALENVGWRDIELNEKDQTVYLRRPGARIGLVS